MKTRAVWSGSIPAFALPGALPFPVQEKGGHLRHCL